MAKFVSPALGADLPGPARGDRGRHRARRGRAGRGEGALEQYSAQLAEARSEAAQIRDQARAEAQQILEELRAQAREESARIIARGEEQLGRRPGRRSSPSCGPRSAPSPSTWPAAIVGESLADEARRRGTVDRFLEELDATASRRPTAGAPADGGPSRAALAQVAGSPGRAGAGCRRAAMLALADELFAVARLLDRQLGCAGRWPTPRARRRPGRAGRPVLRRPGVATRPAPSSRAWPGSAGPGRSTCSTRSIALATEASLDAADARGELDDVEDELFRFGRIVSGDPELARILSDRTASAEGKAALLERLLDGRVSPVTEQLLRNVLTGSARGARRERRRAALRGRQQTGAVSPSPASSAPSRSRPPRKSD